MGAEEGTHDMMWEEIEEGADELRVKGGRKGGKASQIVARAWAAKHWAPTNALGLASKLDAVNYALNGGEEGCSDKTREHIAEGATKKRKEGGELCKTEALRKRKRKGSRRGGETMKTVFVVKAQDDCHSHACIQPECGMFCTPGVRKGRKDKDNLCICYSCQVYKKETYSLDKHICRNCHQTGKQCWTTVCAYIICPRSQKFCEHLHAQGDATKISATEASAVQASVLSP